MAAVKQISNRLYRKHCLALCTVLSRVLSTYYGANSTSCHMRIMRVMKCSCKMLYFIREIVSKYGGGGCGNTTISRSNTLVLWRLINSRHPRSDLTLKYQWNSYLDIHMN